MAFFSATMGYFVVASFKTYGLEYFNDDKFITIVGSIGNGLGGICRILWGMLSDKFGFVKTFAFLVINQALLILTFSFVSSI
jgi:hypothetical protein